MNTVFDAVFTVYVLSEKVGLIFVPGDAGVATGELGLFQTLAVIVKLEPLTLVMVPTICGLRALRVRSVTVAVLDPVVGSPAVRM